MKIPNSLTLLKQSTSSNTAVNSKFKYKNAKVLTATAKQSTAVASPRVIIKAVDLSADLVRLRDSDSSPVFAIPRSAIKPKDVIRSSPTNISPTIAESLGSKITAGSLAPKETSTFPAFIPRDVDPTVLRPRETPITGFIPFFDAPILTPQEETQESAPIPLPGLNVTSSMSQSEAIVFGNASYLLMPLNPEMSESWTGAELKKESKPRIVAVIAENVVNGYPQQNCVVFKKVTSPGVFVTKYTIYRKAVFRDREFIKIKELFSDDLTLPEQYVPVVRAASISPKNAFIYIDREISRNATYVYKIEVSWVSKLVDTSSVITEEEVDNEDVATDGDAASFVFIPGALGKFRL